MCACWMRPARWWSPSPSTLSPQPSPGAQPCLPSSESPPLIAAMPFISPVLGLSASLIFLPRASWPLASPFLLPSHFLVAPSHPNALPPLPSQPAALTTPSQKRSWGRTSSLLLHITICHIHGLPPFYMCSTDSVTCTTAAYRVFVLRHNSYL